MRVLVWTSRDLYSEGGERTYMLSKQKALEDLGCAVSYIVSRMGRGPVVDNSSVLMQTRVHEWFLSDKNYLHLRQICQDWNPHVIVASGIWITHFWKILALLQKEFSITISFDMQGVLEELTEYDLVYGSKIASRLLFKQCRKAEALFLEHCADHIEVVSNNMARYVKATYPRFVGPITVVPCGISSQIGAAEYKRNRHRWTESLRLDPSRPAAVYAGGVAGWQQVNDVVGLARDYPGLQVHLFLVGPTSKFPSNVPLNVQIKTLPHSEATEALCAFDYGFLLRRNDKTNLVAFPNKVGEYLNARLKIIIASTDIGCIMPEFAGGFIKLTDADLSTLPGERGGFDLSSIVWPNLGKRLLSQYEELRQK